MANEQSNQLGDFIVSIPNVEELRKALLTLQPQLPTHQKAAMRRAGMFLAEAEKKRVRPLRYDAKVEKSIGYEVFSAAAGNIVAGVRIGPGHAGPAPIHTAKIEHGWSGQKWPPFARIGQWAGRRIPSIEPREVFYIVRALARKGAPSKNNPRWKETPTFIEPTWNQDVPAAEQELIEAGFGMYKAYMESVSKAAQE